MKKSVACLIFAAVLLALFCDTSAASHVITHFRDNQKGAASVTFDDGYLSQISLSLPLLNARKLKATFFAIAFDNWIKSHVGWETWRNAAKQGHEIGSHTVTHPNLSYLSDSDLKEELSESQETIDDNVPFQDCLVIAYPSGASGKGVQEAASEYYVAGRGTWVQEGGLGGYLNYYETINFLNIGSYGIDEKTTLLDLEPFLTQAEKDHAWFVVHFHELKDNVFLKSLLDRLVAKNIWVAPVGTIARYMQERIASKLTVISDVSEYPNWIKLSLSHELDPTIYKVPLTIRSTVPSAWKKVRVQQGGTVTFVIPTLENGEPVVYYNAVPNEDPIVLSKEG